MTDQPQGAALTAAHTETVTYHVVLIFPEHAPRSEDSHYHVFNETRARLKRLGALVCWIGNKDCAGDIELHHSVLEDALINDVDRIKVALDHPVFTTDSDDTFLDLVQGEGNLLPLCRYHHIGCGGIHAMPYPGWQVQKWLKDGVSAPSRAVQGKNAEGV